METSWPDNLSYKHATASKRSSDAGRNGANSRVQVQEHRSDVSDWPWARPHTAPGPRTRLSESESRRHDGTTASNRQKPTWEEEGIRAATEYLARHSHHDTVSTATPSLRQHDERNTGEASRDQSWLRSFASKLSEERAGTTPVTFPLKTAYEKHYGALPVDKFLSNEPVAIHTVNIPDPTPYLSLTSDRTPTPKAPSPTGSVKLVGGRTPPRKDSPTPYASPTRYSADGRNSPCSVSLDIALKDMYETLRKAHTLFSSYQTTFEEGAGSVIGRFKEAPLNLAWRDMLAEQFSTDADKRQFEAVKEGLGTRAQAVMASLHEHTSTPNDDAYHLEERARAARKVLEHMEEVSKLVNRAREERMGCKFLLEEVDELMGMLSPETHPRLYSDMEEKRWVGAGHERTKHDASRLAGRGTDPDRTQKKSGSMGLENAKQNGGGQGQGENDTAKEASEDQSWPDTTDNNGDSGYNGNDYWPNNDNDHQQASNHDVGTNWDRRDESGPGTLQKNTGPQDGESHNKGRLEHGTSPSHKGEKKDDGW